MSKLKIIDKKSEKSINSEREFLSLLNHPFIVNMHYAFQDKDNLYLVMDMLSGGDLRYHISRYRRFSEEQTRFFIACMVYTLEYIHTKNVIHRDIKPENLVLDDKGYVRITDFGIAKENLEDNSSETSGTPGYMSPEVMKGRHHSFQVDFFAIGIIGYEFMIGKRPYYGKNRKEIKEQMLSRQACIKKEDIQHGWSPESADFINKLLERKPNKRLGVNGAKELKEHLWLKYYPWEQLENKTLPAPFMPENRDNFDKRYCESMDKITEETKMRYEEILIGDTIKQAFVKFYYNKEEVEHNKRLTANKNKEKEKEKEKDNAVHHNDKENNGFISNDPNKKPTSSASVNNLLLPRSQAANKIPIPFKDNHNDGKQMLVHSGSAREIKSNNQNASSSLKGKYDIFEQVNNNMRNGMNTLKPNKYLFNNYPKGIKNNNNTGKHASNGLGQPGLVRSSSVINIKNNYNTNHIGMNNPNNFQYVQKIASSKLKANNNNNNIGMNNNNNKGQTIYTKKQLNRVNSASKILSRSSSELAFHKSQGISYNNHNNKIK